MSKHGLTDNQIYRLSPDKIRRLTGARVFELLAHRVHLLDEDQITAANEVLSKSKIVYRFVSNRESSED